jgi:type II secretion system protein C
MKMKRRRKYIKAILLASCLLFYLSGYVYSEDKAQFSFKLLGTILEPKQAKSITVIQDIRSGIQRTYKIGDKVSGYQIVKIMRGSINLLKDGKITLLELPLGGLAPVIIVSSDERIINRAALAKKIPDLNAAITQVVPIPYIESGKIIGFKVTRLKDKALSDMAGIKEGDIATRINGQSIDSIQKVLDLYHNSKTQEKIDLEIKRGKAMKTLTYYID